MMKIDNSNEKVFRDKWNVNSPANCFWLFFFFLFCSIARIIKTKQWCEMLPCLEGEGCDLLINKSGWTCTQPGGRIKTTTVGHFSVLYFFSFSSTLVYWKKKKSEIFDWFWAQICKVYCLIIKICTQVCFLKYTAMLSQRQEKCVISTVTKSGNYIKVFLKGTSGLTKMCIQPEDIILLLHCTRVFLCWGSVGYKSEHMV